MYKTETHLHTKPVSACAHFWPEEMIGFYKDAGYHTVFISDHFSAYHFDKLGDLTWLQKVTLMHESFLRAKAEGDKLGINVLFSPEMSLCGNHYLLYGADLEFFASRDDFFEISLEEFCRYAKANGVFIVQAHPFRDGKCHPEPMYADGFEVINTNPRHENFDAQAMAVATEYNKPVSAGSDAHRTEDIAGAAMVSDVEIKTTAEYLELLKSGKLKLMKHGTIL